MVYGISTSQVKDKCKNIELSFKLFVVILNWNFKINTTMYYQGKVSTKLTFHTLAHH